MIATRTALLLVAVTVTAGCNRDRSPVALPEGSPRYDGNHTMGSGNRTIEARDTSVSATGRYPTPVGELRGNHTMGSGN